MPPLFQEKSHLGKMIPPIFFPFSYKKKWNWGGSASTTSQLLPPTPPQVPLEASRNVAAIIFIQQLNMYKLHKLTMFLPLYV